MTFRTTRNFKRGQYIFNRYRKRDLIYLIASFILGLFITITYLSVAVKPMLLLVLLFFLPFFILFILTVNTPIYFNISEFIIGWIRWNKTPKKYIWDGYQMGDEDNE